MNAILDVVDAFHTVRDRKGPFYRLLVLFFFLMIRRPPRSTLFPTRRSSDLGPGAGRIHCRAHRRSGEANGSRDRKSTRLNSSHTVISYAVFCLKKKKTLPLGLELIHNSITATSIDTQAVARKVEVELALAVAKRRTSENALVQLLFFFNDTATTEIYTLSLHDALPI